MPRDHEWVERAEGLRARYGLAALRELDSQERFDPRTHLRPANAAPLIWLVSMFDAERSLEHGSCVAVCGNSMGWYTALAVAGALDFDDGFRLVQEMALLQEEAAPEGGGQVLYPTVGEDWRVDPARVESVRAALAGSAGEASRSIELGGYAVLAGSQAGVRHLLRALPPLELGRNRYPFQLLQHGPYHTPLCENVARRAGETLSGLDWRRPRTSLVDGRGRRFTPWSADVGALRDYTLGEQVVVPFDFTLALRLLLGEYAPDELLLPGPGNSLGGVCGQVLVQLGWRGVRSKSEFEALQASERALVRTLGA